MCIPIILCIILQRMTTLTYRLGRPVRVFGDDDEPDEPREVKTVNITDMQQMVALLHDATEYGLCVLSSPFHPKPYTVDVHGMNGYGTSSVDMARVLMEHLPNINKMLEGVERLKELRGDNWHRGDDDDDDDDEFVKVELINTEERYIKTDGVIVDRQHHANILKMYGLVVGLPTDIDDPSFPMRPYNFTTSRIYCGCKDGLECNMSYVTDSLKEFGIKYTTDNTYDDDAQFAEFNNKPLRVSWWLS